MSSVPAPLSPAVGDVFEVPLSDSLVAHGQVAAAYRTSGGHFYLIGFRSAFRVDERVDIETIVKDRIALLALSMDPLLRIGHWPIVGSRPVDEQRIPWPSYKVAIAPDTYVVEDYLGHRQRTATAKNIAALRSPTVIAPIRFQNAMKALHGLGEWLREYDDLVVP